MAKKKKVESCPLCGQPLDLYCTGNKRHLFVDGKNYDKLCFTCYNVPKTTRQTYDENGNVDEDIKLPYSPKYLHTAKDLFDAGMADTMVQARRSVASVRASIKATKMKRGTKLTMPKDPGIASQD